jgi:Viral coat protein P2 N-terminal domain
MKVAQLASFSGLALGQRATAQIPAYASSLGDVTLQFSGALTKATITEIVMKVGSRTFFGPISATDLDRINKYKRYTDHANFLPLLLTEKDAAGMLLQEMGGIDIPLLGGQPIFVEVLNNAGSLVPVLSGDIAFLERQFKDTDKDGKPTREEQLMSKLLRYSLPNTGTRLVWQPLFGGAQIKRVYFMYAGSDWTTSANGNLVSVDVRQNGVSVFERPPCLANRYRQLMNDRVPQSRCYVVDFVADNNHYTPLNTLNTKSLEFVLELTASDNVTAYVECLDIPGNL